MSQFKKYTRLLISSKKKDLIWLHNNKDKLENLIVIIILVVINKDICLKVGKNVHSVLYLNDESIPNSLSDNYSHEKNYEILCNSVYNIRVEIPKITSQKLNIIGGCYTYGLMTAYTNIEKLFEVDIYLVSYGGCKFCILEITNDPQPEIDELQEILDKSNLILKKGMPGIPGGNPFPLNCPSDSCYTIEFINKLNLSSDELNKLIKDELTILRCS